MNNHLQAVSYGWWDRKPEQEKQWIAFADFCANLRHGEISRLVIQDGLPVLAEVVKEKVKFT